MLKTSENRKKNWCVRLLGIFNITRENLLITKHCHSSVWSERLTQWFAICELQIFSGGAYHVDQPHAQTFFPFPPIFFGTSTEKSVIWADRRLKNILQLSTVQTMYGSLPLFQLVQSRLTKRLIVENFRANMPIFSLTVKPSTIIRFVFLLWTSWKRGREPGYIVCTVDDY